MLPEFDLRVPQTLPEALALLAKAAPDVLPVAGGTDVIVGLRATRRAPSQLISLGKLVELVGVRLIDNHIVVGARATIADLLSAPIIQEHGGSLTAAASQFANPLIRNRATVGGNLAAGSPAADMAPPLMVLEADVALRSLSGSRWIPLDEFFTGVHQTERRPDELITAIRWSGPPTGARFAYYKLGLRKADAVSVISVAVGVVVGSDGVCSDARIALGAVAPRPIRAKEAEACLRGKPLTVEGVAQAARLSGEAASPIDDIRGSAAYRRRTVETLVRRLLNGEIK